MLPGRTPGGEQPAISSFDGQENAGDARVHSRQGPRVRTADADGRVGRQCEGGRPATLTLVRDRLAIAGELTPAPAAVMRRTKIKPAIGRQNPLHRQPANRCEIIAGDGLEGAARHNIADDLPVPRIVVRVGVCVDGHVHGPIGVNGEVNRVLHHVRGRAALDVRMAAGPSTTVQEP